MRRTALMTQGKNNTDPVPQLLPGGMVCDAGYTVGWESCEVCGATMDEPCRLFWRTKDVEERNDD